MRHQHDKGANRKTTQLSAGQEEAQRSHRGSVAKGSVERFGVGIEKVLYVCETLDLKLLRFLLDHLSAQQEIKPSTHLQAEPFLHIFVRT